MLKLMDYMERIRVASLQYYIRPVQTFEQFSQQVEALVETAADYDCHLVVFPEYFTVQLLTLNNIKRPIETQFITTRFSLVLPATLGFRASFT